MSACGRPRATSSLQITASMNGLSDHPSRLSMVSVIDTVEPGVEQNLDSRFFQGTKGLLRPGNLPARKVSGRVDPDRPVDEVVVDLTDPVDQLTTAGRLIDQNITGEPPAWGCP